MRILSPDLITEYYSKIKQKYPHLTYKQVEDICQAPFIEVRRGIESENLPTVRLKFFGTFLTSPKRVAGMLTAYERKFKELRMTPAAYFKKKEMLDKYLKNHG